MSALIFKHFNVVLTPRHIRNYQRQFGFRWRRLRRAPYLTENHKLERYLWCLNNQHDDFSNHVFVDETKLELYDTFLYHWRYPTNRPRASPQTSKDRNKINIFGGISFKVICIFYYITFARFGSEKLT